MLMEMPSEQERKNWWMKIYAYTSFQKSLHSCQLLLNSVTETTDDLYLPLALAVHAFYGRPFKKQQGVGKLSEDYIPPNWGGLHKALLIFRDKILVHTDAEIIQSANQPLHNVVYHNTSGQRWFSTGDPRPRLKYYHEIASYLPLLIQKVGAEIEAIHDRFASCIPSEEGHFQLHVSGAVLFSTYVEPPETLRF